MDDQSREKMTKGITKAITDFGNIMSQGTKLKSQMLANTIKAKQNVLYKQMEQESQNKMILQNFKQMYENSPGEFDFEKPKLRQDAQGGLQVYQPQPRDLEFSIKYNQRRIQMKQKNKMTLNPQEERFAEKYPMEEKGTWEKSGLTDLARNKVLGALQTGKVINPLTGTSIPLNLRTQEQAIKFMQQQGYVNYDEDPEIMEIINKLPSTKKPTENRQPTSRYKTGETRVVEGVTYKRNDTGQWLPQ